MVLMEKNIIIKNKSICDKEYFNYNYKIIDIVLNVMVIY